MRLPFRPILVAQLGWLGAWGALGCSSDHSLLAQKPDGATPSDGASIYGTGGDNQTIPRDSGLSSTDGADPEPPGAWTLTWVNGLVDEESTRVCFVPIVDGREVPPAAPPVPSGDGLPFAGTMVMGSIPSVDLATNDLHPYLVPKSAGVDPATTCDALLAAQAADASLTGLLSLPIIPAGTLSDPRSYLAVTTGCATPPSPISDEDASDGDAAGDDAASGDASSADASAAKDAAVPMVPPAMVCGLNATSASAGIVLVRLSRILVAPKLGFQVVHASAATPDAVVVFTQPLTGNTLFSITKLGFGQIAPAHDAKAILHSDLRANAGSATVRVAPAGNVGFAAVEGKLGDILMESGLDVSSLDASETFTFVLLGARAGTSPNRPWHPFDAVLVKNAPSTGAGDE